MCRRRVKKQGKARGNGRRKVLQSAVHSLAALASFSRFHIFVVFKTKFEEKKKIKSQNDECYRKISSG